MEGEDYEIGVLRRQYQFFGPFPYSCWKRNGSIKVRKRDVSEDVKVLP